MPRALRQLDERGLDAGLADVAARAWGLRPVPRWYPMKTTSCKIAIPVRVPSWLTGDLGNSIEQTLRGLLRELRGAHLTRLPRGFLVEAFESPGPMLEAVQRAVSEMEARVEEAFPALHVEMGPVWTGTLQAIYYQTPKPRESPPASAPAAAGVPLPTPPTPPVGAPEVA